MLTSVIAILLALPFVVGLILVWRGWRGVPDFGEPRCTLCACDLRGLDFTSESRLCPGCGADLRPRGAVRFGDYRRRPRLIVIGGALLGIPVLVVGLWILQAVLGVRWEDFRSNKAVIVSLATNAGSPSDWRLLKRRYAEGSLSGAEVAAAIDKLIPHVNTDASTRRGPMQLAHRFVRSAMDNGHVSTEQLARLCDAFYGQAPVVRTRQRVRQGKELKFEIRRRNPHDLPGTASVHALRAVRAGDKLLDAIPRSATTESTSKHLLSGDYKSAIDGALTMDVPSGQYEVEFDFDWGLLDESAHVDSLHDGRPGHAGQWPNALVTRKRTVKVPIEVVPPDAPAVELVTDPALDPSKSGQVSVATIQVFAEGETLSLKTNIRAGDLPVPVWVRMRTRIGDKDYDLGWYGKFRRRPSHSKWSRADTLPADVTAVTVVLEPAPELAEERIDVDRIWGKPIVIENVPLERYDLEESGLRDP